jgi:four helix bundle protein
LKEKPLNLRFYMRRKSMATFKKSEEIECWKRARELTRRIYEITSKPAFSRDFGLKDQIRRASVSIMSNIAEGYDRSGTAEFVQFLATAKGSAAEVRCQLYVAADQNYIQEGEFTELSSLAAETGNMVGGLIKYLRGSGLKGTKYKDRSHE